MTVRAYYNEIDPYAAAWLRNLIAAGLIAPGDVDERDIRDVRPDELRGYTQCHFFAGIGVWSYALRLAGWPDERPVWTGSCPCQSFSAAGKRGGFADERHLWPHWFHLIEVCRPATIFGEQVASKDGLGWLDLVQADLEGAGYACGAVDTCSAGSGAPHIRQRLRFVAEGVGDSEGRGRRECRDAALARGGRHPDGSDEPRRLAHGLGAGLEGHAGDGDDGAESGRLGADAPGPVAESGADGGLADADGGHPGAEREQRGGEHRQQPEDGGAGRLARWCDDGSCCHNPNACDGNDCWLARQGRDAPEGWRWDDDDGGLADADRGQRDRLAEHDRDERHGAQGRRIERDGEFGRSGETGRPGPTNGFWRDADWLLCRDGKWRPVEPGTFPLAHGAPARVGRLRAYGNAIDAEATRAFIEAYLDLETIDLTPDPPHSLLEMMGATA